jgi:hypothetical protein
MGTLHCRPNKLNRHVQTIPSNSCAIHSLLSSSWNFLQNRSHFRKVLENTKKFKIIFCISLYHFYFGGTQSHTPAKAGVLSLEPCPSPFFAVVIFQVEFIYLFIYYLFCLGWSWTMTLPCITGITGVQHHNPACWLR